MHNYFKYLSFALFLHVSCFFHTSDYYKYTWFFVIVLFICKLIFEQVCKINTFSSVSTGSITDVERRALVCTYYCFSNKMLLSFNTYFLLLFQEKNSTVNFVYIICFNCVWYFILIKIVCVEHRNTNINNIHGRTGSLPGRVRITSKTIAAEHGPHNADKRTGQNIPLSSASNH